MSESGARSPGNLRPLRGVASQEGGILLIHYFHAALVVCRGCIVNSPLRDVEYNQLHPFCHGRAAGLFPFSLFPTPLIR